MYVTAEPWPGIPIRKGNRKHKAADLAAGTWPNLTGKFKPHDDRHTHSTWLDASDVHKVLQMDRRGHAMRGMDAVYVHPTDEMRQRLCDVLEKLWQDGGRPALRACAAVGRPAPERDPDRLRAGPRAARLPLKVPLRTS